MTRTWTRYMRPRDQWVSNEDMNMSRIEEIGVAVDALLEEADTSDFRPTPQMERRIRELLDLLKRPEEGIVRVKYKDELLQQIAAGVNRLSRCQCGLVQVTLDTGSAEYSFGLAEALDVLANDLYWDERGNWGEARMARVDVI